MMGITGGKNEHINDFLWWTLPHGHTSVDEPARTYIHRICADTRWSQEKLLGSMDDTDEWCVYVCEREREKERKNERERERERER